MFWWEMTSITNGKIWWFIEVKLTSQILLNKLKKCYEQTWLQNFS